MLNLDEENYKEAVESSYKVSVTPGISKFIFKCSSISIILLADIILCA